MNLLVGLLEFLEMKQRNTTTPLRQPQKSFLNS